MRKVAGVSGGFFAALAVICGAFAAHALRGFLGPDSLALWHKAVEYQFFHAFGLLLIAMPSREATRAEFIACAGFMAGILFFCGSLYALALGAPRWVGMFTPLGGVSFIVGWAALAHASWRNVDKR